MALGPAYVVEKTVNALMTTVAIWVQLLQHPVPDRVKPSFVIFDIRALSHSALTVRVPGYQKLKITHGRLTLFGTGCVIPVPIHMATVGVKGLNVFLIKLKTKQL